MKDNVGETCSKDNNDDSIYARVCDSISTRSYHKLYNRKWNCNSNKNKIWKSISSDVSMRLFIISTIIISIDSFIAIIFFYLSIYSIVFVYHFNSISFLNSWHCFVGRNFGCFVTHEHSKFIYFYIGQTGVCLFSTA